MRLDQYLVQKGYFRSRERAKEAILSGQVFLDGKQNRKVSFQVMEENLVELSRPDFHYVGRGALKLKFALESFKINPTDKICLDIGVATGGFSQVLLEKGASKVYAVDIGEGQLSSELLNNQKLVFRNKTDARFLKASDFMDVIDLIVIDVSFISILSLIDALKNIGKQAEIIALIKPQFEYGKKHDGIIKDVKIINSILKKVKIAFENNGFQILEEIASPILGKAGNQEFLWRIIGNF